MFLTSTRHMQKRVLLLSLCLTLALHSLSLSLASLSMRIFFLLDAHSSSRQRSASAALGIFAWKKILIQCGARRWCDVGFAIDARQGTQYSPAYTRSTRLWLIAENLKTVKVLSSTGDGIFDTYQRHTHKCMSERISCARYSQIHHSYGVINFFFVPTFSLLPFSAHFHISRGVNRVSFHFICEATKEKESFEASRKHKENGHARWRRIENKGKLRKEEFKKSVTSFRCSLSLSLSRLIYIFFCSWIFT